MNKYVIDLELAKKLEDLRVKSWGEGYNKPFVRMRGNGDTCDVEILYPAFTNEEMLERLPSFIYGEVFNYELIISKKELTNMYIVKYEGSEDNLMYVQDKKLSNALARMWIWLIENGYVEV